MSARALKAVPRKSSLLLADEARAATVYADPDLAARWLAAVRYLQSRPEGSIWCLDNRAPAKWRSQVQS